MEKHTFELVSRSGNQEEWNAFLEIMKEMPAVAEDGPWLCGGAIRRIIGGQPLDSDFDYFFAKEEQVKAFEAWMVAHKAVVKSSNDFNKTWAISNRLVQQITVQYYGDIGAVLDSFDFTICQFGYDGTHIFAGPYALWDLGRKRLAVHRLTYGVSTLRRLMKYARQGFTVCSGTLADILQRTVEEPDTINAKVVSLD